MKLPSGWESALPKYTPEDKGLATRQYSQIMLNALAPALPGLIGGSADLAPSNLTLMKMFGDFQKNQYQVNIATAALQSVLHSMCSNQDTPHCMCIDWYQLPSGAICIRL